MSASVFIKLFEWMKPHPVLMSYIAIIIITVLVTVPTTIAVQVAKDSLATMDTVVVSQRRLERALNNVFEGLDYRLKIQDEEIKTIKNVIILYRDVNESIFLDVTKSHPRHPVFEERLINARKYTEDKWRER